MSLVRFVTHDELERLLLDATQVRRRRLHLNVHKDYEENPQILYNCLLRGSYMRPHRHVQDQRQEFFACLEGDVLAITFDHQGVVQDVLRMAPSGQSKISSVTIQPTDWHTLVCLSERATLLEVKPGPFRPALAKEFAPWSPAEDDCDGVVFLHNAIARHAAIVSDAELLQVLLAVK